MRTEINTTTQNSFENKQKGTEALMRSANSTPSVSADRLNAIHDAFDRAEKPKEPFVSKRNQEYEKNMNSAYNGAKAEGKLGLGFGGEKPEGSRPAPAVMKVGRRIVK